MKPNKMIIKVEDDVMIVKSKNMEFRIKESVNMNWMSAFFLELFSLVVLAKERTGRRKIAINKDLEELTKLKGLN